MLPFVSTLPPCTLFPHVLLASDVWPLSFLYFFLVSTLQPHFNDKFSAITHGLENVRIGSRPTPLLKYKHTQIVSPSKPF